MSQKPMCPLNPDPEGRYCAEYCRWYDCERADCRFLTGMTDISESLDMIANAINLGMNK